MQHLFELFLKGFVVYLAIVGTSAGFYFETDSDGQRKMFFAGFIISSHVVNLEDECGCCLVLKAYHVH